MQKVFLKGVNLGGWLILERWITPSLFEGISAHDEYTFLMERGTKAQETIEKHRSTFITSDDFAWIAHCGLNAVRIPLGYWVLQDGTPFISAVKELDFAMHTAQEQGLFVVLDLHAAPGSQNGWNHSGKKGEVGWTTLENIHKTLEVIELLAIRYKNFENLYGIELLNEPRWDIPQEILVSFYTDGFERIRKHCAKNVAVVFHDGFRPWDWNNFFPENKFPNMILDSHLYQTFAEEDKKLSVAEHLKKTHTDWKKLISFVKKSHPIFIGEWSVSLDPISLGQCSEEEKKDALLSYGKAQLEEFEKSNGWFYWTYKTEDSSNWNFRNCVERGILPNFFD